MSTTSMTMLYVDLGIKLREWKKCQVKGHHFHGKNYDLFYSHYNENQSLIYGHVTANVNTNEPRFKVINCILSKLIRSKGKKRSKLTL